MNLDAIEENLRGSLQAFNPVIIDKNTKRINSQVLSWPDYSPGIGHDMYIEEFKNLVDKRQFSILFSDSSFAQIYYEFDQNNLIHSKLSYYPVPFVRKISFEEFEGHFDEATDDMYMSYYSQLLDLFGKEILYTNSNHIRFDYSVKEMGHFKNHIQFGGINEIRIPLKFLVLPFTFLDFIVRNVYVDIYDKIVKRPSYLAQKKISSKLYHELEDLTTYDSFYLHKVFEE